MSAAVPFNNRTPFVELYFRDGKEPINVLDASTAAERGLEGVVYLHSLTYEITSTAGNRVSIDVTDPLFDVLQEKIRTDREKFAFRFGWRSIGSDGREDERFVSPKIGMRVTAFDMSFTGDAGFGGTRLTLEGNDQSVQLATTVLQSPIAFDPNTLASRAMEEIISAANDGSLEYKVYPTKNFVGTDVHIAANMTPMQQLRRLMGIAAPSSGAGRYILHVEPGTGTKSRIVIEPDTTKGEVKRQYLYSRSRVGEVISYSPRYRNVWPMGAGGRRFQVVYWDPGSKTPRTVISDRVDDIALGPKYNEAFQGVSRASEIPYQSLEAVQACADATRQTADSFTYQATLIVLGDVGLKMFDQIEIQVMKDVSVGKIGPTGAAEIHKDASGYFRVYGIVHQIVGGRFTTSMTLMRTAGYSGAQAAQTQRMVLAPGNVLVGKTIQDLSK